jgi:hypothetical protein
MLYDWSMDSNYATMTKGSKPVFVAYFAKRNTNFGGGGKKLESESEGGQKFLPPNPLPFCPPEQSDFKIRNSDFRQKMFELRPKNTAS